MGNQSPDFNKVCQRLIVDRMGNAIETGTEKRLTRRSQLAWMPQFRAADQKIFIRSSVGTTLTDLLQDCIDRFR